MMSTIYVHNLCILDNFNEKNKHVWKRGHPNVFAVISDWIGCNENYKVAFTLSWIVLIVSVLKQWKLSYSSANVCLFILGVKCVVCLQNLDSMQTCCT